MPPEINPFAALSLIVAPAVLTNASSVLIMSTSNRLARAVDRARKMTRLLEATDDLDTPEAGRSLKELTTAEQRALMLLRALRSFYVALSGFASATLLSLLGAVLIPTGPTAVGRALEVVAVAAGLVAVGGVIYGSVLLVRETRLAVAVLRERAAGLRFRAAHPGERAG
jgi:hypothetical protein